MKQIYIGLIILFSFNINAQISISKFSLPYLGATLKTYFQANPNINYSENGANKTWNFSNLNKTNLNEVTLLDPSQGSIKNLDATFLIKETDFVERYFRNTGEFIEEIYLKTLDPVFNTFEISNSYKSNPVYRKGTIINGQSYSNEYSFKAPISWDVLPDTITSGIGFSPDSIAFTTKWKRNDKITGYGTVKLPDGNWDALKEETSIIRNVSIEVYFFGTWIEAPADVIASFLGDFSEFLNPDTTYSVNFYSDLSIEVLAAIQLDGENGNPLSIQYKAGSEITNTSEFDSKITPDVSAYPNPSFGNLSFKFENCRTGTYSIQVFDIFGKKVWSSKYNLKSDFKPFSADLSTLQKGTYLYTIHAPSGQKICTKRLVILNP